MLRTHLALVVALAATGCGTAFNVQKPTQGGLFTPNSEESRRVYGGVRFDVENLADCGRKPGPVSLFFGSLILLDLPLSAAADTLTLPLTVSTTVGKLLWPSGALEPEGTPPVKESTPFPPSASLSSTPL